jgi:hypothetical protein
MCSGSTGFLYKTERTAVGTWQRIAQRRYAKLILCVLLFSTLTEDSGGVAAAPDDTNAQAALTVTIAPTGGEIGKTFDVLLQAVNCPKPGLQGTDLVAPQQSHLSIKAGLESADGCTKQFTISIPHDAPPGTATLSVQYPPAKAAGKAAKQPKIATTVPFEIQAPSPKKPVATATPSSVVLGTKGPFEVTVGTADCGSPDLRTVDVVPLANQGLNLGSEKPTDDAKGCQKVVQLSLASDARVGQVPLLLITKGPTPILAGSASIEIVSSTPISGTAQPQTATGLTGNQGIPLKADLTVKGNVSVQAVLIPYEIGRRVFGKEIAKKYAIVQLTINNRSADAALIVQGAFIDYHDWALAGLTHSDPNSQQTCVDGTEQEVIKDTTKVQSPNQACTVPSQVASVESRIARGELLDSQPWTARNLFVNGLALLGSVASAYTFSIKQQGYIKGIAAFNGTAVPGLGVFLPDGTVGQLNRISDFGYQTNKVISKQGSDIIVCFFPIDRFLTPGFKKIFLYEPALLLSPYQVLLDRSSRERIFEPRFNHVSVNPNDMLSELGVNNEEQRKHLASVLPCFLTLSRAPSADSTNPAANSPNDGTVPTTRSKESDSTKPPTSSPDDGNAPAAASKASDSSKALTALDEVMLNYAYSCKPGNPTATAGQTPSKDQPQESAGVITLPKPSVDDLALLMTIGKVSLNSIRVVVDGIMTVEVGAIPAKIDSVEFDDGNNNVALWTTPGVKKGTIKGLYLTGGKLTIAEAAKLGITQITMTTDGSTDQALRFSFNVSKPVPVGEKLTFVVSKTDSKDATKTVDSMSYVFVVSYTLGQPTITKVVYTDNKITVTGTGFADTTLSPLKVVLHPSSGGSDATVKPATTSTQTEIDFDAPLALKDPGCWEVKVTVGTTSAPSGNSSFPVLPVPTIKTATRVGKPPKTAEVTGSGFVDTSSCDGSAIAFQLLEDKSGAVPVPVKATITKGVTATFDLPAAAAKAGSSWSVQVLLGKDVKDTAALK